MLPFVLFLTSLMTFQDAPRTPPAPAGVIVAAHSDKDWLPAADPSAPQWAGTSGVQATLDFFGKPVPLAPTEFRARWTGNNLYLLFICPYRTLYLKPDPVTDAKTNKLWDWDVAEAFIGTDFQKIGRYKEFEVSPRGEFVDLDINRDDKKAELGLAWDSGFKVSAKIDTDRKIWYGEMRIPFASLGVNAPKPGDQFRAGLYRIEGGEPNRIYVTWQPTGIKSFHQPAAFGRLVLK